MLKASKCTLVRRFPANGREASSAPEVEGDNGTELLDRVRLTEEACLPEVFSLRGPALTLVAQEAKARSLLQ